MMFQGGIFIYLFSILLIGIALSMDTFSLSLGLGTFISSKKKALHLSLIVGVMHFVMPLCGMILGNQIIKIFKLQGDFLLGIILIFIAIQMLIDLLKKDEEKFNLNLFGTFLFALGVSLDSFSIGLGIKAITDNIYLATSIFAACSFVFTYGGILLGQFANKIIGAYANILGIIILFILGLCHLL